MIKQNFLTGEYVVFSLNRAKRPKDMKRNVLNTPKNLCPFCIENKHMIQDAIYTNYNEEIKLINNKYPILSNGEDYGIHFVLIDTKSHDKNIVDFSNVHMYYIMKAMQDILNILYTDKKLRYVQIFKNQGINAGASQSHSHWQIIGLSMLPNKQRYMLDALKKYKQMNNACYFCNIDYQKTIVCENSGFVAFCPEDALYCYEINIMPKDHITSFRYFKDDMLNQLGSILKISIEKLNKMYLNLDYNICVYNSFREEDDQHFFIQIIPRMGNIAGFEFSTGMFVNCVSPQDASNNLRSIKI